MRSWLEYTPGELAEAVRLLGQPGYRARQLHGWLHARRAASFDAMQNLPAGLRGKLAASGPVRTLRELERREAADGLTVKWLFAADAAERELVESVLIVEKRRTRRTVCVSCMIGCPLACVFCATGRNGFGRNLATGEIMEQVYAIDNRLAETGGAGVSHVVFMGMGEPLLNLDAVLAAADAFASPEGMGLSGRHITISTAGIPEGVLRLAESGRNYRLAVSLHAPNQAIRERVMPAAKRWPLDALMSALETFARSSSRDITFEYCLMDGVNAGEEQARELAALLGGFRAKVNLIPMNPVPESGLTAPSAGAVRRFQEILEAKGISAPVRMEKGAEIGGACGQLRAERARRGTPG